MAKKETVWIVVLNDGETYSAAAGSLLMEISAEDAQRLDAGGSGTDLEPISIISIGDVVDTMRSSRERILEAEEADRNTEIFRQENGR